MSVLQACDVGLRANVFMMFISLRSLVVLLPVSLLLLGIARGLQVRGVVQSQAVGHSRLTSHILQLPFLLLAIGLQLVFAASISTSIACILIYGCSLYTSLYLGTRFCVIYNNCLSSQG